MIATTKSMRTFCLTRTAKKKRVTFDEFLAHGWCDRKEQPELFQFGMNISTPKANGAATKSRTLTNESRRTGKTGMSVCDLRCHVWSFSYRLDWETAWWAQLPIKIIEFSQSPSHYLKLVTWFVGWTNPIWKIICSSNWSISLIVSGWNSKNMWPLREICKISQLSGRTQTEPS